MGPFLVCLATICLAEQESQTQIIAKTEATEPSYALNAPSLPVNDLVSAEGKHKGYWKKKGHYKKKGGHHKKKKHGHNSHGWWGGGSKHGHKKYKKHHKHGGYFETQCLDWS